MEPLAQDHRQAAAALPSTFIAMVYDGKVACWQTDALQSQQLHGVRRLRGSRSQEFGIALLQAGSTGGFPSPGGYSSTGTYGSTGGAAAGTGSTSSGSSSSLGSGSTSPLGTALQGNAG